MAAGRGVTILPVDSEHSALFQLVAAAGRDALDSVVITASGGPFRGKTSAELGRVTREQALAHPTWSMGEKITIDSATLMNKGLEVIEAHHLFGLPYERIEVVVHPQSLVHALVRLVDGALLSHLGSPDMRVPIAFALHYPERVPVAARRLDLGSGISLEFASPDESTFPAIRLAREAGLKGDRCTCALNAANEVAVQGVPRWPHRLSGYIRGGGGRYRRERGGRFRNVRGGRGRRSSGKTHGKRHLCRSRHEVR